MNDNRITVSRSSSTRASMYTSGCQQCTALAYLDVSLHVSDQDEYSCAIVADVRVHRKRALAVPRDIIRVAHEFRRGLVQLRARGANLLSDGVEARRRATHGPEKVLN